MEEKINIAELLKDCPKDMELDCTLYDNVKLDSVLEGKFYPIKLQTPDGQVSLNKYGCYSNNKHAKCIIFPKGKTSWEDFHRPFKDGDILFVKAAYDWISIYKESENDEDLYKYVATQNRSHTYITYDDSPLCCKEDIAEIRFATEEEKAKLFQAIKENGYHWNAETKTLEKLVEPKFKVGDEIVKRNSISNSWIVYSVSSEYYGLKPPKGVGSIGVLPVSEQDNYELLLNTNKFDITTLKPFESKVLVRDSKNEKWEPAYWGFYDRDCSNYPYKVITGRYNYCIPYKGNEYLLGTTDDCNEFYKTWE